MQIAIFSDSFLPYCSGVTVAVIEQARQLVQRGHRVTIFRPKPPSKYADIDAEVANDIEIVDVPLSLPAPRLPKLRLTIPTFVGTIAKLRKDRPDLIHVNTEWGCGWEGVVAGKLLGIPLVGTFHTYFADPGYLKSLGLPNWAIIRWLLWRYSVIFFSRCEAVTSPSQNVKQALVEHGVRNSPQVISNGVPSPPFISAGELQKRREELGLSFPTFVYCGRLAPEKSLDILLRAFHIAVKKLPHARLLIIGEGPYRDDFARLAESLGLTDRIHHMGMVPHARLLAANLPRLGDAFVTASKTENQPLSVLEAMRFQLPIIGPCAKGLREMIMHGINGLSFTPDDVSELAARMVEISENDSQRTAMGKASLDYVREHSIERAVDQLETLYEATVHSVTPEAARNNLNVA